MLCHNLYFYRENRVRIAFWKHSQKTLLDPDIFWGFSMFWVEYVINIAHTCMHTCMCKHTHMRHMTKHRYLPFQKIIEGKCFHKFLRLSLSSRVSNINLILCHGHYSSIVSPSLFNMKNNHLCSLFYVHFPLKL